MNDYMSYICSMLTNGRFVVVSEDGVDKALILFSICDDPEPFLNNVDRQFIEHNPDGRILVIEDILSYGVKFSYRKEIERVFCARYPNLEKAMWRRRRFPHDKIYTVWRKRNYVSQH